MSKIVNGASLQPRSGGPPKQIVLLLHGFGSSGADIISLAPHWQDASARRAVPCTSRTTAVWNNGCRLSVVR